MEQGTSKKPVVVQSHEGEAQCAAEATQKIYLSDYGLKIGSKYWEGKWKSGSFFGPRCTVILPVSSISAVERIYNPWFWLWFVFAAVMLVCPFLYLNYGDFTGGMYLLLPLLICIIIGIFAIVKGIQQSQEYIKIYSHNSKAIYVFAHIPRGEAAKYLAAMQLSLSEK